MAPPKIRRACQEVLEMTLTLRWNKVEILKLTPTFLKADPDLPFLVVPGKSEFQEATPFFLFSPQTKTPLDSFGGVYFCAKFLR